MAARRTGKPRWNRSAGLVLLAAATMVAAVAADPRSPPRRAKPPAADWDRATRETFYEDAFSVLTGPRPDFSAAAKPAAVAGGAAPAGTPTASGDGGGGFKWSSLVSGDTLVDEIKALKDRVTPVVATPSTFKGGGYDEARESFSVIALAFGLIAAHDEDVRWKKEAANARDLFARAGFNCKTATDQSFNESKLCVDDLAGMLDGNPPERSAERDEDFQWHQVAARPALMSRLELAEKALAAGVSSAGDFSKQADVVLHEAEMVAAIAEVIRQPEFEYFDDDSYLGYAAAMRDGAAKVREACLKKDHAAASAGVVAISKACTDCHGEYR